MRIRAIEVRNWGCIEALSLDNLSDGINVLHGPNRTGKSSLVQAIRSGLFDHLHDSQDAIIQAAIPWKTKATPMVAIEFEHAGTRFRVSKTFAKTREGKAALEHFSPAGWVVLERGKEAAKKVRTLVGVESSEGGVFQMLWQGQQDFTLPKPRDVDPTLVKALESVLGTLITGRDIDFKERLDEACERWFTDRTGQEKRNSPLAKLENELEEALEHKADIERVCNETDAALTQYEEALASQPALKGMMAEAENQLAQLATEREAITMRKSQNELAVRHRDAEMRHWQQASLQLQGWEQTDQRRQRAEKDLVEARLQLRGADERLRSALTNAEQARAAVEQAERDLSQHQQTRAAIDDRRQLAHLCAQGQALDRAIDQVQDWLKTIHDLELKLTATATTLTMQEIEQLRQKRDEATLLRAQLEAGEIQVVIQAKKPLDGAIVVDGQPAADVLLIASTEQEWRIRRQAELTLGKIATVRIRRLNESRDLEAMTERLAELERVCREALVAANVDSAQPTALDDLVRRRLEHEAYSKELGRLRDAAGRSAPEGLVSLQAQRQQVRDQEEGVRTRRPGLRGWVPRQAELDQLRSEFDEREQRLLGHIDAARKRLVAAEQPVASETAGHQILRDHVARLTMEVSNANDSVALSDRAALALAVDEGKVRLVEAEAKVVQTTLTPAERSMETQFQAATQLRSQYDQRLRANDLLLEGLRVKLTGTEGLHQMRIQAEQAVNDLTREREREMLYAQSHKHLKAQFEQIRQGQVRRTVGPINERVMQWTRQLGLTDYSGLAFGDEVLPGGLVPTYALNGEAVEFDSESYGTLEQLTLLIRLAVGGLLSLKEPAIAVLDDPLAHADIGKHRKMLEIIACAAKGDANDPHPTGPLQLLIFTCHEDRFAGLEGAQQFDLARLIRRGG